jgi:purine nucleoside permease
MRYFLARVVAVLSLFVAVSPMVAQTPVKPWPVRVVIVTTFEVGKDTGDVPGEFQFWVEREHLDEVVPFPGGTHPLRTNKDHTILGVVSGTTLVNSTASMMALGLDPRFDLTHAYVLINGIAGVDPKIASMGSAAWAKFVVNDVAREIDPREAPKDWPYGDFPTSAKRPDPPSVTVPEWMDSDAFALNSKLVDWAYGLTKDVKLGDDEKVAAFRALFTGDDFAAGRKPPFVLIGDTFASDKYWHGTLLTKFAEDWVRLWTQGQGVFAMTEMEDAGFMEAINRLNAMGRMDKQRVLVLRTGSNYCEQQPGHDAVESVTAPYIGGKLALESAYSVGSVVVNKLVKDWPETRDTIPGR